ncbi:hypothetical protein G7Y79_00066g094850 [Physcia stellaris]|nr:hypothetical protein G7Y79_00066g094850 [Physcia stellaris]
MAAFTPTYASPALASTPTPAATSKSAPVSSTSEPDLLPFSSALCDHVPEGHPMTRDLKTLYSMHLTGDAKALRCSWFTQAKRAQESYHLRKHELEVKNKLKEEMKQLTKQKEEARLAKKRAEGYTCRRCKNSTKFDSNIKLHEHIRTRHAKKPKAVVSPSAQASEPKAASQQSMLSSSSSSQSVISSAPTSPKLVAESPATPISSKPSLESLSVATPRKPIFWAEIASRSVVAFKFSRLPIATPKSVCKSSENASIACPPTPPRAPTPSRPYLTVDDLFRMFAGKPSPFGLQRHQMRSFSPRGPGKCSPASKCGPIQSRITSYFHAVASPASKSAKSEAFAPTHDSVKQSARTSPSLFRPTSRFASVRPSFSAFSRPSSVCRHCQGRFATYWPTGWATPNASRFENNEIPMGQRYWSFAPPRPTLGEY